MERCHPEPTLLQTLRAHTTDVSAVDVTRAGAGPAASGELAGGFVLGTGGADGGVRLWRWTPALGFVSTADVRRAHRYGVTALSFSGAGALLASCGGDGSARVWTTRDLRLVRNLQARGSANPRALCWVGPVLLLTAQDDGALVLWDVKVGAEAAFAAGAEGAALAGVAALCGGRMLVTVDAEGVVRAWTVPDLHELWRESGSHDPGALCVSAAGAKVATGGHDAVVRLWTWKGGELVANATLAGHASAVTAVRWTGDEDTLGSASMDRSARLWSCSREECLRVLDAHVRFVSALAFSPDDGLLVTGSNDRTARVWALREDLTLEASFGESCSALFHFGIGNLEGIAEIPDDVCGAIAEIRPGHGSKEEPRALWEGRGGHGGAVNSIAAHGDLLATACSDRVVRVFRRATADVGLELQHALSGHRYPAMAVDFFLEGVQLVSGGLDGLVILWDLQSGSRVRTLSAESVTGGGCGGGGVRGVRAGSGWVLAASDDGVLALWDLADSRPAPVQLYTEHEESVTCCAQGEMRDESVLVAGGAGGELVVYRASPPSELCRQHHAHDMGVQSCDVATTSDAALLVASCGCDSVARVWSLNWSEEEGAALREIRVLRGHGGTVTYCRLGGPSRLATTATDMYARVWCLETGTCVACVRLAGAGGAVWLSEGTLVTGALSGDLALWELPSCTTEGVSLETGGELERTESAEEVARWSPSRVTLWLLEHFSPPDDDEAALGVKDDLISRIEDVPIDGARLLLAPLRELMLDFGFGVNQLCAFIELEEDFEEGEVESEQEDDEGRDKIGARGDWCQWLMREVRWLRAIPRLRVLLERRRLRVAHGVLCPVSHRALLDAVSCADGFTYDRAALDEAMLAAESHLSPISGRPLAHTHAIPNMRARLQARRALVELHRPSIMEDNG